MTDSKEYIEREALISICEQITSDDWNRRTAPESWVDAYECFMEDVEEQPAADVVEVRHGKWNIVDGTLYWVDGKCSVCGYTDSFDESGFYKYCPECGAKMDGEVGDENA